MSFEMTAIADFDRCGGGRGAECCIWLTVGRDGYCCERFGPLHTMIIGRSKTWSAKRKPVQPFPDCQLPTDKQEGGR